MEVSHTKNYQRILIWIIAIVMTAGFVGSYFLIMMNNNSQASDQAKLQELEQNKAKQNTAKPDARAYTVKGRVTQLQINDLKVGTGPAVKSTDTITVHYKGTLAQTGQKFDSSYDRGEPVTLQLGNLIRGWQVGIPGMKVGGIRRLVIPADMAYGQAGNYGVPSDSDLVFEIELLKIGAPAAQQ